MELKNYARVHIFGGALKIAVHIIFLIGASCCFLKAVVPKLLRFWPTKQQQQKLASPNNHWLEMSKLTKQHNDSTSSINNNSVDLINIWPLFVIYSAIWAAIIFKFEFIFVNHLRTNRGVTNQTLETTVWSSEAPFW